MPVVETATGRLRGEESGGVSRFLGVPYADPPLGARRFLPSDPVRPWNGERDATDFGARCVQADSLLAPKGEPESEDCLFLNVWSPDLRGRAPVMVWIHGGSFTGGSGALSWYDGAALAARGVVVVTVNYRLGPFGFLHLEALGGERWAGAANAGLSDQRQAVEWVRGNIDAFGGDPTRLCLFGESAGAMSVGAHLGDHEVTAMLQRAVLQSGSAEHVQSAESGERIAASLLSELGLAGGPVERLLEVGAGEIIAASRRVDARSTDGLPLPFQPTVDGTSMKTPPLSAIAGGSSANVDVLYGTTADEMQLFVAMAALAGGPAAIEEGRLLRRIERAADAHGVSVDPSEVAATYRAVRGVDAPLDVWSAIATDLVFTGPARRTGEAHLAGGGRAHRYLYTHRSTAFDGVLGAAHATEIPFVFDNLDQRGVPFLLGEITGERRRLAHACADAWVSFAATGRPAADGLPRWDPQQLGGSGLMRLDVDPVFVDDPHAPLLEFWEP